MTPPLRSSWMVTRGDSLFAAWHRLIARSNQCVVVWGPQWLPFAFPKRISDPDAETRIPRPCATPRAHKR